MSNVGERFAALHVFDVGQGDSILVELADGEIMVVDCHIPQNDTESPILQYLKSHKTPDIDILCLTHPDRDHYNGMVQLIDWIRENGGKITPVPQFNKGKCWYLNKNCGVPEGLCFVEYDHV